MEPNPINNSKDNYGELNYLLTTFKNDIINSINTVQKENINKVSQIEEEIKKIQSNISFLNKNFNNLKYTFNNLDNINNNGFQKIILNKNTVYYHLG